VSLIAAEGEVFHHPLSGRGMHKVIQLLARSGIGEYLPAERVPVDFSISAKHLGAERADYLAPDIGSMTICLVCLFVCIDYGTAFLLEKKAHSALAAADIAGYPQNMHGLNYRPHGGKMLQQSSCATFMYESCGWGYPVYNE